LANSLNIQLMLAFIVMENFVMTEMGSVEKYLTVFF
jgi:hypothetical protein